MGIEPAVTDELDPDAPWKPGFEWPDPTIFGAAEPADAGGTTIVAPFDDDLESWSRAAVEEPISWKDWVPPPELRRQIEARQPPGVSASPGPQVIGQLSLPCARHTTEESGENQAPATSLWGTGGRGTARARGRSSFSWSAGQKSPPELCVPSFVPKRTSTRSQLGTTSRIW